MRSLGDRNERQISCSSNLFVVQQWIVWGFLHCHFHKVKCECVIETELWFTWFRLTDFCYSCGCCSFEFTFCFTVNCFLFANMQLCGVCFIWIDPVTHTCMRWRGKRQSTKDTFSQFKRTRHSNGVRFFAESRFVWCDNFRHCHYIFAGLCICGLYSCNAILTIATIILKRTLHMFIRTQTVWVARQNAINAFFVLVQVCFYELFTQCNLLVYSTRVQNTLDVRVCVSVPLWQ